VIEGAPNHGAGMLAERDIFPLAEEGFPIWPSLLFRRSMPAVRGRR